MKITEISIKRPVLTTMMVSALVVLGTFSYFRLGVDQMPNVEFPFVVIQTTLRGAGPEEIESSVTKPIEESVNTISGIEELNSTSFEGLSMVLIKFKLEKNGDVAAQEVRDKINAVLAQLPQGTDQPVVSKFDIGAMPVVNIVVSGNRDLIELTQFAKKKIKENIETVGGVGSVDIIGGREREIHIVANPMKMASLNLSAKQLKDAIIQQNIEIPGGKVEQPDKEFVLRTLGRIPGVKDFNSIVVASVGGTPIRISDIARVEDTGKRMTSASYLNGKPAVTLVVKKQSGSNTVEVVRDIRKRVEEIQPLIPPGIETRIVGDQSEFIKDSVRTVEEHLILGAILAGVMVLLFLGDLRSTLISAMAIPASLIATFIFLDYMGFTLNTMTLLGLTIAVGLVIDDAIVMLENIYRHMEEHRISPFKAAMSGASEIGFAIIAMSLSLMVIFVPLAYMGGIIGRFVKSYGLTIAFAIAVSTFVALTLTPMLCSLFLKVKTSEKTRLQRFTDRLNEYLASRYIVLLEWALARRRTMVAASIGIILSMIPLFMFIGKDFLPTDDTGKYQITIKAPEGTSLEVMKRLFAQIEAETKTIPYVVTTLSAIGTGNGAHFGGAAANEGYITVELTDLSKRPPLKKIMAAAREMLSKYTGLRTSVTPAGGFGGGEKELQYVLSGPDLDRLASYAKKVEERLKGLEGVADVDLSFSYAKPEYRVEIDRDRAHDLGVKIEDIATSLRTLVGGEEDITKYKEGDELYQVRVRADSVYRNRKDMIEALVVPAAGGRLVRLDSVATVVEGLGPTQIERYNRQRKVTIEANSTGMPLGNMLKEAEKAFKELKAPPEYKGGAIGRSKELGNMLMGFLTAFLMAFIFIYIVLASQFESFVYPIAIIIALPLTVPFAVISLFLTGQSVTLFGIMGIFMLFGIVKKNAILQVDYTNTLRAKGMSRHAASIEANKTRLRPILMTTLTLVACMIPTALGTGAGSGSRRTMAWVIIGGQSLSLLITLLMTPVTYTLFDDLQEWFRRKYRTNDA
ncbi:MAG TPA: efflux RND transporter permease subunit [Elusimicrobiales bacterium]|nr:efflux RND transporter permease subunit [Elusimicrobiales bacterium]